MKIEITSTNKSIVYTDDVSHFEDGVLRLLSMNKISFVDWINYSSESNSLNIIDKLRYGFNKLKNQTYIGPYEITQNNHSLLVFEKIAENPQFGVMIDNNLGWLVEKNNNEYIKITSPPEYEEPYFEGDKTVSGGYGEYISQTDWRLEKSRRQVQELIEITGFNRGKVLDVGCGYGFFRKALNDYGFNHDGIEISKYAVDISKRIYGFDTMPGTLKDHIDNLQNTYDIVTLWDVIEHVPNPEQLLSDIYKTLKPGGFVIIKTPNINCPEVDIFGSYYHSFKREHLVYFSSSGLKKYAEKAGLNEYKSTSVSHLLKGFVNQNIISEWEQSLQGADLVSYFRKN